MAMRRHNPKVTTTTTNSSSSSNIISNHQHNKIIPINKGANSNTTHRSVTSINHHRNNHKNNNRTKSLQPLISGTSKIPHGVSTTIQATMRKKKAISSMMLFQVKSCGMIFNRMTLVICHMSLLLRLLHALRVIVTKSTTTQCTIQSSSPGRIKTSHQRHQARVMPGALLEKTTSLHRPKRTKPLLLQVKTSSAPANPVANALSVTPIVFFKRNCEGTLGKSPPVALVSIHGRHGTRLLTRTLLLYTISSLLPPTGTGMRQTKSQNARLFLIVDPNGRALSTTKIPMLIRIYRHGMSKILKKPSRCVAKWVPRAISLQKKTGWTVLLHEIILHPGMQDNHNSSISSSSSSSRLNSSSGSSSSSTRESSENQSRWRTGACMCLKMITRTKSVAATLLPLHFRRSRPPHTTQVLMMICALQRLTTQNNLPHKRYQSLLPLAIWFRATFAGVNSTKTALPSTPRRAPRRPIQSAKLLTQHRPASKVSLKAQTMLGLWRKPCRQKASQILLLLLKAKRPANGRSNRRRFARPCSTTKKLRRQKLPVSTFVRWAQRLLQNKTI